MTLGDRACPGQEALVPDAGGHTALVSSQSPGHHRRNRYRKMNSNPLTATETKSIEMSGPTFRTIAPSELSFAQCG